MDPASVIGVIGVVGQITQAICVYGDALLDCKNEIANLRSELFGIQAALTHIEQDLGLANSDGSYTLASPNLRSCQPKQMLEETRKILEELAETLSNDISRSRRLARRLVWPLKRQHIHSLAVHLEYMKTYFIFLVTKDTLQVARDTQKSVLDLQKFMDEVQHSNMEESMYLEAREWLTPCDSEIAHTMALSTRLAGTNSWFIDDAFLKWTSGTTPLLWLSGLPGSGKTCLTAACAEKLLGEDNNVVYFYCSRNDSASQDPRNMIGSLIVQLSQKYQSVRHQVLTSYNRGKSYGRTTHESEISTLVTLMVQSIQALPTGIFIFVDAVDECGEKSADILQALFQILTGSTRSKIMLSSTEKTAHAIQTRISEYNLVHDKITMDRSKISGDINTYINAWFAHDSKIQRLKPELQVYISESLQTHHQGSFRWAYCTIEDLKRGVTPKSIKKAMEGVAPTLAGTYMRILESISGDAMQTATLMLEYLVSGLRRFCLSELAEAVSFTMSDDFDEEDRLFEPEAIVHSLHSLVHYDPSSGRVELAHSSVRDFLTSQEHAKKFYIDPIRADIAMARVCVLYLTLPAFQTICPSLVALETRKNDWPFWEYASFFWTRHARNTSRMDEDDLGAISTFTASADLPGGGNFAAWYQCVYPKGDSSVWSTKPLYMFAREGLTNLLGILLKTCSKDQLEQRGGARGSTALHVAATYGEAGAVRMLLDAGADPNERNSVGESGIQWAAFYNHRETVRLLLEAGVSPVLLERDSNPELYDQMVKHSLIPSSRHADTDERGHAGPTPWSIES